MSEQAALTTTVVMPCYNAEAFVGEALESVLAQSHPADEIIVVDDCSTDRSAAIVSRYPVRLLRMPGNSGDAAARNLGIDAASGAIIANVDSDDRWRPHHLATVVGLLRDVPEAALACTAIQIFGDGPHDVVTPGFAPRQATDPLRALFRGCPVPHPTSAIRRAALLAVGKYRTGVPEIGWAADYDLWLRLAVSHKFVCSHEITVDYRRHASQMSRQFARQASSAYHARHAYWLALQADGPQGGDPDLADELAEIMRQVWLRDLRDSRQARRRNGVKTLRALRTLVPGARATTAAKWALMDGLGWPVLAMWDALPPSLRRRIQRVLRRPLPVPIAPPPD